MFVIIMGLFPWVISIHASWDEGVRMNPELQPNVKIINMYIYT